MPFGDSKECDCRECGLEFAHAKKLSEHIKKVHKSNSVDYYVKHFLSGTKPSCPACSAEPRFVSLSAGFKKFCPEHRSVAESLGGQAGGKTKKTQKPRATQPEIQAPPTIVQVVAAPVLVANSSGHKFDEVVDFVKSLGVEDVELHVSNVVSQFSLDLWIPSKRTAIEYHNIDWKNGNVKEDVFVKNTHRKKYLACRADGVRLLQFFSDEWNNKPDICKSMIRNALGKSTIVLSARHCKTVAVTQAESKAFADANHVSGTTRARHHIGLVHRELGLVGLATTRTPIQKKYGNVCELARMCFLKDSSIRGGASKLLSHVKEVAKKDGFSGLLSYSELRYGEGNVYKNCGFELVDETTVNYGYSDATRRYDRFKFRAQPGKTEKQVAQEADVRTVWGSGNKIYLLKF
jgi:GNAT superfamily N-acetyltransferase